jgi:hypothetical protein
LTGWALSEATRSAASTPSRSISAEAKTIGAPPAPADAGAAGLAGSASDTLLAINAATPAVMNRTDRTVTIGRRFNAVWVAAYLFNRVKAPETPSLKNIKNRAYFSF